MAYIYLCLSIFGPSTASGWESDDVGLTVWNKMLGCMLGFTNGCQVLHVGLCLVEWC